jgi:hypothetical protein
VVVKCNKAYAYHNNVGVMMKKHYIAYVAGAVVVMGLVAKPASAELSKLVEVTNWPSLFNTREQNVDGNGHIKVHEQGTVDVSLKNTDPIAVTTVAKAPKTVKVLDNVTLQRPVDGNDPAAMISEPIDVEGYSKVVAFAESTNSPATPQIQLVYSVNGDVSASGTAYGSTATNFSVSSLAKASQVSTVAGPKVQVRAAYGSFSFNYPNSSQVSVTLYLMP